jgi:hypothetical protein
MPIHCPGGYSQKILEKKSEKRRMCKNNIRKKDSGSYGKEPAEVAKGITDVKEV